MVATAKAYIDEELIAIYELGRLYFEMGYFTPAERIFAGLTVVDNAKTPSRIGLGVIKLERGLFVDAINHFRRALQEGFYGIEAKIGLSVAFLAQGDVARAKSVLVQVANDLERTSSVPAELRTLWQALALRCEA